MNVNNYFEYCDAVELLNQWGVLYTNGTPKVSDAEYDELYNKVLSFEKMTPEMILKESPTKKLHGDSVDGFVKTNHKYPMLSIQNSNGYAELKEWLNDKWIKGVREFVIEFKIDGLALSLIYNNGELVDAVTRGNGSVGDSVISNAKKIKSIPQKLSTFSGEIRGEVVWLLDSFFKHQAILESEGKDKFANPRNGAAGTLKSKDPMEVAKRDLDFVAYSVVEGSSRPKHSDDLMVMKSHGFMVSDFFICSSVDEVLRKANEMEMLRDKLSFLTDGLVIKTNTKSLYNNLGGTAKTPHYLTALKFPPEEKEVEVLEIEHSYGRSGAITPVCIVKPIQLSGTIVERASLHNWDILEFLGLYVGCKVVIRKAGEIIPEVIRVSGINKSKTDYELFTSKNNKQSLIKEIINTRASNRDKQFIERPSNCKHCNTKLINPINKNGELLISLECPNPSCPIKEFKAIVRFVSKEGMDIFGVDESILEKMLSAGIIKNVMDLYKIKKEDILKIDGFQDRSAEKIISAIDASRKNTLNQLIVAFGIPNCGKTMADKLSVELETLERLLNIKDSDLSGIPDVGPETSSSILNWVSKNSNIIKFFIDNKIGLNAKAGLKKISDKLSGLTMIMTGTSPIIERQQFKDIVVSNGGKVVSGISAKVDYVIVGDSAGPDKLKKVSELKAKGSKIQTISDEDFLKMV